jgi:hypothetical protein
MYDTPSLESILKKIDSVLPRTVTIMKKEPIVEFGYMTSLDMQRPMRTQTIKICEERHSKLIGILFCHPKSPLGKAEIVEHLPHFHHRSGDSIDFYCVGYVAYWPPEHHADQQPVACIEGIKWLFSEHAFNRVINEVESETSWQYSGETELILLNARKNKAGLTYLDYNSAIVCNLESMSRDKAFSSVRAFFSDVFRFAAKSWDLNPAWELSDNSGLKQGRLGLKEAILSILPKVVSDTYIRSKHFAIKSLNV